jgi:hypothetical protein
MKKITKITIEFIIGRRAKPVEPFYPGVKTLNISNRPSFQEWCKEFRVSMLYDRKLIEMN